MFESHFLTSSEESRRTYRELLSQAVDLVAAEVPSQPYNGKDAAALAKLIGTEFLPEGRPSKEHVAGLLRTAIANSINVNHPHTIAHLHCPPLLPALAAEVVITALNQSMDSFDQAPLATVLEQKLVSWLCNEIGYPQIADGTLTAGGTQSNYQALLLARDAFAQSEWNWSVQKLGLPPNWRKMRVLCSEVAHFTVEKSMSQLGLGADGVIRIKVDEQYRMEPQALRSSIESLRHEGLLPFAIVATAGTTDFGSIDPLPEITEIARSAECWLHVDAAYGGALLFSPTHRARLHGIEGADSVSIDFHKLLWQPIPCGALLLRNRKHFDSMRLYADYLNPASHEQEGIPDLVTKSLLTSRRFDALKMWISFQSLGRNDLANMVDRILDLAGHAAEIIRSNPAFQLLHDPSNGTVVFRYRSTDQSVDSNVLNIHLHQQLFDRGLAVIGQTRVGDLQCLKFTCMNPVTTYEDIEQLISTIAEHGRRMEAQVNQER